MQIINRTQFNDDAIIKAWDLKDLASVEYVVFESERGSKWVEIKGAYENGERISALVSL